MTGPIEARTTGRDRSGLYAVLGLIVTLAFFWPTLWTLPGTWDRYDLSHGWLIAALVGLLAWRDRAAFMRSGGGDPLLLLPILALSLLWLVATISHMQVVHQAALVLLLMCWALAAFGRGSAQTTVVMGASLLLALPLWDTLIPILRPLTTVASGGLVKLLGIPAQIQGDLIHIPSGTFLVADGCAGLKFLISALVLGIIYAHIMVRGWRAQIAVVGVAAAVAIVGNWIRVAILIVVGHVTEMQAGLIENHIGFGWVTFTIGLIPFFLLAGLIERRASRAPVRRAPELSSEEWPQSESDASQGSNRNDLGRRVSAASALAIVGPLLYFVIGALPATGIDEMGLSDLAHGQEWRAVEAPGERPFDWRPGFQGAEQHDTRSFTNGVAHVYGDRLVYREQGQGAKLIGYPNRIAPAEDVLDQRVIGPVDPAGRRWVRQAVVRTSDGPVLAWYWYRVGGVDAFTPVHAKALEIPAFLRRHRAAELIALSTACDPEDCTSAFESLAEFMGARRPAASEDGE